MGNEIQTLNERIAERVGSELVDLMPDGDWQKLVDSQLLHFKSKIAPGIINEMLTAKLKEDIKAHLDVYCTTDEWNQLTQESTNEAIVELIKSNSSDILASMLSPVMSGIVQDFRQRLGY